MGLSEFMIVCLIAFFAACVQGMIGFGFGLVALAMMSLFLQVSEAAVLNVWPALAINVLLLWRLRDYFRISRLTPLIFGVLLATPVGVLLLNSAAEGLIHALLAVVLFTTVAREIFPIKKMDALHPLWVGAPMGALSGVLTGLFGTGGPPLVAYVTAQRFEKQRHVASIQAVLGVANLIRIEELLRQNAMTFEAFKVSAATIVAVIPGALLGLFFLKYLPGRWLRCIVLSLLLMIALQNVFLALKAM